MSPFIVNSSSLNGKYISEEVTTRTDALQDIRQCRVSAPEPVLNESLALETHQQSAPDKQFSKRIKAAERGSNPKKQRAVLHRSRNAVRKVQRYTRAAALRRLSTRNVLPSFPPSSSSTPLPLLGAAGLSLAKPVDNDVYDEQKKIGSRQLMSRPNVLLYDQWSLDEEDDDEELQEVADTLDDLLNRFSILPIHQPIYRPISQHNALIKDVCSARNDIIASVMLNRTTAPKLNAQRLVRRRAARSRAHRFEGSRLDSVCSIRLKVMGKRARRPRQALAESCVEANEDMTGLEFGEPAEAQVKGGDSIGAQTCQQAGADIIVETEVMVGIEVQEVITESLGVSQSMDLSPDSTQQAVIGFDVYGAMEVDDETPDPACDEANAAGSPDSMDIDPLDIDHMDIDPVDIDPMDIDPMDTDPMDIDPMDIDLQCNLGKLNREKLQDAIRRGKAKITLRKTSTNEPNSGEVVSGSDGAVVQSSQEYATPASTSESGYATASMLPAVAQNLVSTNSDADLREARLGKRPESRTAPEEVTGPSLLPSPLTTGDGGVSVSTPSILPPVSTPSTTASSHSTTTSTSTPSTSVSSSPPDSPLPRNRVSSLPAPASVKAETSANEKEVRDRDYGSLDDSCNEGRSSDEVKNAKRIQGDQNVPNPESPKVSATRRVLLVRPMKRKARIDATEAGKPEDHRKAPGSRALPTSQATQKPPAESFKKARNTPKDDTDSETVAPLNDIPDNRGRKYSVPRKHHRHVRHDFGYRKNILLAYFSWPLV